MKIALLADIHANLHALKAVCADAKARGCSAIWHLGDAIGYGAFPDEAVRLLADECSLGVAGNYDIKVLSFSPDSIGRARPRNPTKLFAMRWAYDYLSGRARRILARLGEQQRPSLAGQSVLMTHSGPGDRDHVVTPETSDKDLANMVGDADADIVLIGHSHRQIDRTVNSVRVINPGSVGRPEGGDPRACYAILTEEADGVGVEFVRLDYDWLAAAGAIRQRGLPDVFAQMTLHGINFREAVDQLEEQLASEIAEEPGLAVVRALRLGEQCAFEVEHAQQVSFLSLQLFDLLQPLHCMSMRERVWLQCASLLHDIGWMYGRRRHHKNSMELILAADDLFVDERERRIVASIARYHRRALPTMDHEHYARLQEGDRHTVRMLGGILRLADGLDRTHGDQVRGVSCARGSTRLIFTVHGSASVDAEIHVAQRKSNLLAKAFHRQVVVQGPSHARTLPGDAVDAVF